MTRDAFSFLFERMGIRNQGELTHTNTISSTHKNNVIWAILTIIYEVGIFQTLPCHLTDEEP